jgi:ribonuclease HI
MKNFERNPEVREAEAVALLVALTWLQQYNMQQIQIETYCMQVVQGVEGKVRSNREFGVIWIYGNMYI